MPVLVELDGRHIGEIGVFNQCIATPETRFTYRRVGHGEAEISYRVGDREGITDIHAFETKALLIDAQYQDTIFGDETTVRFMHILSLMWRAY